MTTKSTTNKQSIREIARTVGLAPSTVSRFLHMPKAPKAVNGRYDLPAAMSWIRENASHLRTQTAISPEVEKLRIRELTARCRKIEFAVENEQGGWCRRDEMLRDIVTAMREIKHSLKTRLRQVAVKLQGCDAIAIEEVLLDVVDDTCTQIAAGQMRWQLDDPPAGPAAQKSPIGDKQP